MSAEGGSSQPPPSAPPEKVHALKPATFSSFINKNPTGKKIAPKAARRRPGAAAAAAAPTSKSSASTPAPSSAETQPVQTETPPSTITNAEPQAAPQLPTPAATQEPVPQSTPQAEQHVTESDTPTEPSTAATPSVAVVEQSHATASSQGALQQSGHAEGTVQLTPARSTTPRAAEEELEVDRSPKRQRAEAAVRKAPKPRPVARRTVASKPVAEASAISSQPVQLEVQEPTSDSTPQQPANDATATTSASTPRTPAELSGSADLVNGVDDIPAPAAPTTTQKPKPRAGRRKLAWASVNTGESPQEEEEVSGTGAESRSTPSADARRKRSANAPVAIEDAEHGEDEEAGQVAPKRPVANARGKRKAASATVNDDGQAVESAPKKPRKTRKDKGTTRNKPDGVEGDGQGENGDATAGVTARPKKRKATRSVGPGADAQGEGEGAGGNQVRQRRSREREPTPSDAEDQTIDPETTFMSNIASRNIRVGRLSERERKMREINWVEVKQRRRDEMEAAISGGREARNKVDEELARAGAAREELSAQENSGPRFQMIDGQITLIQDSGTINREADADRMIELMEEVAEDDLTAPINSSSYMRDNKRFPEQFMVPGQGTRWGKEATDQFYDALRRFGTDFAMINKCFPQSTRRSIKKKFTREEKEYPELIKEALSAPRNTDWQSFLVDAGKADDEFADVDRIKAELAELQKEADVLIKQAQDKAVEEKRQRRLAGAELTDDENPNGKENGKKKKKGRGKQVQFAQEENLEVVGTLDDDPNWGVE
jgi:transcription factor TFIIIB component B''